MLTDLNFLERKDDFLKRRIIDKSDKIIRWPKKRADQNIILQLIAQQFKINLSYTENEVNEIIKSCINFDDYALIRRELFDRAYMHRSDDCRKYWRSKELFQK